MGSGAQFSSILLVQDVPAKVLDALGAVAATTRAFLAKVESIVPPSPVFEDVDPLAGESVLRFTRWCLVTVSHFNFLVQMPLVVSWLRLPSLNGSDSGPPSLVTHVELMSVTATMTPARQAGSSAPSCRTCALAASCT